MADTQTINVETPSPLTHITVEDYLFYDHPPLFDRTPEDPPCEVRTANNIAHLLARENIITKMEEPFEGTTLYFRRDDIESIRAIDGYVKVLYPNRTSRLSLNSILQQVAVAELGYSSDELRDTIATMKKNYEKDPIVLRCIERDGRITRSTIVDPIKLRHRLRELVRRDYDRPESLEAEVLEPSDPHPNPTVTERIVETRDEAPKEESKPKRKQDGREAVKRHGLVSTETYSQNDVRHRLMGIHSGYFTEPVITAVVGQLGQNGIVAGDRLIEFTDGIHDLYVMSTKIQRELASVLDVHHSEIDGLLEHPACASYVHILHGISDTPYFLQRERHGLIGEMRSILGRIKAGSARSSDDLEILADHYKAQLISRGIMPLERDYESLQEAEVLSHKSADAMEKTYNAFKQLMVGYEFSVDFDALQSEMGKTPEEFWQVQAQLLIQRDIAMDVVGTTGIKKSPIHVYAVRRGRKAEVRATFNLQN